MAPRNEAEAPAWPDARRLPGARNKTASSVLNPGFNPKLKDRTLAMTLGTVLLILLILLLVGALPTWPHSREWGYVPSGGLGLVLLVLLILVLMGRV